MGYCTEGHTLPTFKHCNYKVMHPTITIIPYIWQHEYSLKFQFQLRYTTCDKVIKNSPSKIGLTRVKSKPKHSSKLLVWIYLVKYRILWKKSRLSWVLGLDNIFISHRGKQSNNIQTIQIIKHQDCDSEYLLH